MTSIIGSEFQPIGQNHTLRLNDQELRNALGAVYSRGAFAVNTRSYTSAEALDHRISVGLCDASGGTFALTLPYANYWGGNKSPLITLLNIGASGTVTLTPSGSDTVNGGATYSLAVGERIDLVSDGVSAWYVFSATATLPSGLFVQKAGDTMTGTLILKDGNIGSMGWRFTSTSTGMYYDSGMVLAVGAAPRITIDTAAVTVASGMNFGVGATPVVHNANARTAHIHGAANPAEIRLTTTTSGTTAGSGGLWSLVGNELYLWNLEADKLSLGTNNLERFTISSTGKGTYLYELIGKGGAIGHHVDAYGAVGDGTTDDSTAINAAITAAIAGTNGSSVVVFGAKTYKINSPLTIAVNATTITLRGDASHGGTATKILVASGVNGINVTSANAYASAGSLCSVNFENLFIQSAGGVATGIVFGSGGGNFFIDSYSKHYWKNLLVLDFTTGVHLLNARHVSAYSCISRCERTTGSTALYIACDNTNTFCGDHVFTNCDFSVKQDATDTTSEACLILQQNAGTAYVAGIKFNQCNFYHGQYGLYILNQSSTTGIIGEIYLDACQFDCGVTTTSSSIALYLENQASSNAIIRGVVMSKGMLANYTHGTSVAATGKKYGLGLDHVWITCAGKAVSWSSVRGSSITGCNTTNVGDQDTVIDLAGNCEFVTVTGNTHILEPTGGTPNPDYMVRVGASCTDIIVNGNHGEIAVAEWQDNSNEATILANGQIQFPATQISSGDANTLDDYEEGTFTPGISFGGATTGITYGTQEGSYTKTGNRVKVTGRVVLTSNGTATGVARITGLPFTVNNATNSYGGVSFRINNITYTGMAQMYTEINTTNLVFEQVTEAGTATSLTEANLSDTADCIFQVTYRTTA